MGDNSKSRTAKKWTPSDDYMSNYDMVFSQPGRGLTEPDQKDGFWIRLWKKLVRLSTGR